MGVDGGVGEGDWEYRMNIRENCLRFIQLSQEIFLVLKCCDQISSSSSSSLSS